VTASPAAAPPAAGVMQMMTAAWTAQTISTVTCLRVPDLLHARGPLTARQLTEEHGVDAKPEFLERALRVGASVGIFTEALDGRFGPTPLSEVLTPDSPASVRAFVELIGGRWWKLIGAMPEALRTGENQSKAQTGREPWEPAGADRRTQFDRAMKSRVESTRGVLEHYNFSRAHTVVDVGGGLGHLALAIVKTYPTVRATVLDLPDVIAVAQKQVSQEDARVRERLTFLAGDMFLDVPSGDVYVLKTIIHDWDDVRSVQVLEHCRARLPADGRVICVDKVLPPMGDTSAVGAKLLDMLMLVSLPGKERTEAEWRALYERAKLRVTSITALNPRSAECIVEGVAA
jgi:ubiquinone/menaquinone biosynthesis C-methylase UbiE